MLLYYQGLRQTGEFRSRGYRKVDGGRAGMGHRGYSQQPLGPKPWRGALIPPRSPVLLNALHCLGNLWCYLTEKLLERSRYSTFRWDNAVINRCLIGPFIKDRTCLRVSGLSKLLPTLQVLDWQIYYSSRNGLQKILYGKMIYFQKEFYCALIYPEWNRDLSTLSSFVHKRILLKIRITERVRTGRTLRNPRGQPGHFTEDSTEASANCVTLDSQLANWLRYFPLFFFFLVWFL